MQQCDILCRDALGHVDHSQLAGLQQHGVVPTELHLPSLHDADFDRDRKEKR